MASSTVTVKNIAASTSDGEIKDFFSFCGKIQDIKVTPEGETKTAEVIFEKETAMKTALLLNNTQLGSNHISVTSPTGDTSDDGSHFLKTNANRDSDEITQEEKPRTRILAEYLAHGYVVGDATIQRAIELDNTHGISSRFRSTIQDLDKKYGASDKARATDQSYGITQRANTFMTGIGSYFEKASNTPTGKKMLKFYEDGSKQVQEVHTEARRLADLKTQEHGGSAYKASGMEKIFGKQEAKPNTTAAANVNNPPGAPPVNEPVAVDPSHALPAVESQPVDEKTGH